MINLMMGMLKFEIRLFCMLFSLPVSLTLDTACAHVTDRNTTVSVTQIRYTHKFYTRVALASRYQYQSNLDDASSDLYRTTATAVINEIESRLEATRGDSPILYDVVVVRFASTTSSPPPTTIILPEDVSLQADIIISTSDDGVGPNSLETTLQLAGVLSETIRLFYVLNTPSNVNVCLREAIHTSQGSLTWPVTDAGVRQGTLEKCPVGFERAGDLSVSLRTCSRDASGHAAWAQFTCSDCGKITQEGELLELSQQITNRRENDPNLIIIRNAIDILRNTAETTSVSILAVAEILEALARTGNVSTQVLQEVTILLSFALDIDAAIFVEAENLYFSSTRINAALVTILSTTELGDQADVAAISHNVLFGIRKLDMSALNFDWYGMRVNSVLPGTGSGSSVSFYKNPMLTYDVVSTVSTHFQFGDLPASDGSDVLLTYIIYPVDKLFQSYDNPSTQSDQRLIANGWIMTVNLAGVVGHTRGTITTTSRQTINTVESPVCGNWNATVNSGHGGWIQDGCQLAEVLNGDLAVCQCEIRGTFALVKDVTAEILVYPQLNAIVFIGAVVAFLGALLCFVVFVSLKKLRKRQLYRIEAAFSLPVAIFYLVFAAGQSAPSMSVGCAVVAGILHLFILVSACSMVAIAAKYYDTSRRKAVVSKWFAFNTLVPAWAVPVVVVSVTVAPAPIVYQNSIPRCFLNGSNPYALIFALLIPMVACLVGTAFIFFFTNRNVVTHDTNTSAGPEGAKAPWAWLTTGRIAQMTFIFILCYVTWLFLLSVVYSVLPELQYIFGIFAIIQGIAFPIVLCILDTDVKYATLAVFGKGKDSSRSFKPYFSASQWHSNPDIVPENAPKQFLDDSQRTSTLTRQNFDPNVIPLSDTEQRRISKGNGHVNTIVEQSSEEIEMKDIKMNTTADYSAHEEPIGSLTPSPIIGNDRSEKRNGHANRMAVEADIEFS